MPKSSGIKLIFRQGQEEGKKTCLKQLLGKAGDRADDDRSLGSKISIGAKKSDATQKRSGEGLRGHSKEFNPQEGKKLHRAPKSRGQKAQR